MHRLLRLHGFPIEHILWRRWWWKCLFPLLQQFLGLSIGLKITALATPFFLLRPHCQSHWLAGCWKEKVGWMANHSQVLQCLAVIWGLYSPLHCGCCERSLLRGVCRHVNLHVCFPLGVPWKSNLYPEVKTSSPAFGSRLHRSRGIQALSWRNSHSQKGDGWMGTCCNERDWK